MSGHITKGMLKDRFVMQLPYVCIISSCVLREIIAQHNIEAQLGLLAHKHDGYFLIDAFDWVQSILTAIVSHLHVFPCTMAVANQQPASNHSAQMLRTGDISIRSSSAHKSVYWFWHVLMQPYVPRCVSFLHACCPHKYRKLGLLCTKTKDTWYSNKYSIFLFFVLRT